MWDVSSRELVGQLKRHAQPITDLQASPANHCLSAHLPDNATTHHMQWGHATAVGNSWRAACAQHAACQHRQESAAGRDFCTLGALCCGCRCCPATTS